MPLLTAGDWYGSAIPAVVSDTDQLKQELRLAHPLRATMSSSSGHLPMGHDTRNDPGSIAHLPGRQDPSLTSNPARVMAAIAFKQVLLARLISPNILDQSHRWMNSLVFNRKNSAMILPDLRHPRLVPGHNARTPPVIGNLAKPTPSLTATAHSPASTTQKRCNDEYGRNSGVGSIKSSSIRHPCSAPHPAPAPSHAPAPGGPCGHRNAVPWRSRRSNDPGDAESASSALPARGGRGSGRAGR